MSTLFASKKLYIKSTLVSRESGVALITVMMFLVLLSTLAIYAAEQQNLSLRKVANLKETEQAFQVATSGEQWAVKLLENDIENDLKESTSDYDHISEDWANLGPAVKVEGTESLMQVTIYDEQGKFNLNNLIQGKPEPRTGRGEQQVSSEQNSGSSGDDDATWYKTFQRLLENLEIDPQLADVIIDWIDKDSNTTGTTGAEDLFYSSLSQPYKSANQQLSSVGELRQLRGFSESTINRLSSFVTAIPLVPENNFTRINVNTAQPQLLGALAKNLGISNELFLPIMELRLQEPFESVNDFVDAYVTNVPSSLVTGIESLLDVKSDYFISRSCAENGRVKLSQISLLRKNRNKENVTVQFRQSNHDCPELQENAAEPDVEI